MILTGASKGKDQGVSVRSDIVNCQQDVHINIDRELSQQHYLAW